MAAVPKELIGNPAASLADDVLSKVLRTIRLSGSLQFCFMPTGDWQTDAAPSLARMAAGSAGTMPFHVVVAGKCWLKMEGRETALKAGDVVAFPFGTGHQLGAGKDGKLVTPVQDLPPKPWKDIPVLRYGNARQPVRLLCGYLQCDALNFAPLRNALPSMLHVSTDNDEGRWLRATIAQMTSEVDHPRTGGASVLERLTELIFIELLRHHILGLKANSIGWLAALADPALGRCLSLIHDDPQREWAVKDLATACGLSRSTLMERFEAMLHTSPMRYVRAWRLALASIALGTTDKSIAAIAHEAGYGTEAAFSRAFARALGAPPANWRQSTRQA